MYDYRRWKHIFKLDPNKEITDEALEAVCESGTDAVVVGGSDGVTLDNTVHLLSRVRRYSVPCVLEVSTIESISPGFDYYFIPTVLNSRDVNWITGFHQSAIKEYGDILNWDEMVVEGYCILNPDSKVAKLTSAEQPSHMDDVVAYAQMAEHIFKMPVFYMEYSGTFGDLEVLKEVKSVLQQTKLFYGGGITNTDQARKVAEFADTVIVGNAIYDNFTGAINTVKAVKGN